jgi:hypothetical protein
MTSAEPTKGGKILVKLGEAVAVLEAGEAMELASQLAGAAMTASLHSNEVLLRNIEDAKLRGLVYTP